jgi:hypothetical protein
MSKIKDINNNKNQISIKEFDIKEKEHDTIHAENISETEKEEKEKQDTITMHNDSRLDISKLKMVIFLFTNDSYILQENIENYNDKVLNFSNIF